MEYLWESSFVFGNSQNEHTSSFRRSSEHPISWQVWLCHISSVFDASCLLTGAYEKENHSPMVPSEACRTVRLPLWSTVLPHLMFWTLIEVETYQEESCILQLLCWWCCSASPCLVHHRLAAVALLVLEDEESAFWCLVHIVENLMPADYYSDTLITSQVSWAHSCLLGLWHGDLH